MSEPKYIVIFDVGGVLAKNTYNDMIELLLTNSEKSLIHNTLAVASGLFKIYKVGEITEDEFFSNLLKKQPAFRQELEKLKYIKPESSLEDVVMFLKKRLRSHHLCLFPHVVEFAKVLNQKYNMAIGILSNHTKEWFSDLWTLNPELGKVFKQQELVVASCDEDIKSAKPAMECFESLMKRLRTVYPKAQKNQVIFVDDKKRNVDAALKFGINAFVFDAYVHDIKTMKEEFKKLGINVE